MKKGASKMGKKRVKRKRIPFATTLSPEALAALEEMANRAGLAKSGVLETLLREKAMAMGIDLDAPEQPRPRRKGS